jgi:hypothetical protein
MNEPIDPASEMGAAVSQAQFRSLQDEMNIRLERIEAALALRVQGQILREREHEQLRSA